MTKQQYAHATTTTKTATLAELERVLSKYGCTSFISGTVDGDASIAFQVHGLNVLMRVPLPDINEKRFTHTPTSGVARHPDKVFDEHQAAVRATWRALLLFVKAKLVGVDQGLTTIEQEFLPHILLPGGGTFGDRVIPQIREAYATGHMPPLLPPTTRPAIGS
jgi:hypothetical protein